MHCFLALAPQEAGTASSMFSSPNGCCCWSWLLRHFPVSSWILGVLFIPSRLLPPCVYRYWVFHYCFIQRVTGRSWKSALNKPWFILQIKYLRSEWIHCAKIHRALTPGTLALSESYASYHSPRIRDYTKVLHTTASIISGYCECNAPWHAIKVDTDECIQIGCGLNESVKNQNMDGRL